MRELLQAVRLLGPGHLLKLGRAKRWGWEGIIRGHFLTRVIQTLLPLGLFDAMAREGAVDPGRFAQQHDLDPSLLTALCEYLFERRILRREGSLFSLDKNGRFLVESDLLRGWFELSLGYEPVLHGLDGMLRGDLRYGDNVVRDGRFVATGSGSASAGFYFPLAVDAIRRTGAKTVLDIGCGDGTFLRHLCQQLPGVCGVGVDLSDDAVREGRERLRAHGLHDRIRLIQGDALALSTLRPSLGAVDSAITFFVLHEFCDGNGHDKAVSLLRSFRELLPGVPLMVFETIRPASGDMQRRPGPAIEYFLLHDLSKQSPVGRDVWRALFARAGFGTVEERYLPMARSSIFTVV